MIDPIELNFSQQFELERMERAIDSTEDIQTLKDLAKQAFRAWMVQRASCDWVMKNNLGTPFNIKP